MNTPDVSQLVRGVFRVGMMISLALLLIGAVLLLWHPQSSLSGTSFVQYWSSFIHLQPIGFLFAGLIILVLSPLAGIFVAALGFLLRRERIYVVIALTLLLIVLATFFIDRT